MKYFYSVSDGKCGYLLVLENKLYKNFLFWLNLTKIRANPYTNCSE